ncbi:hypothetical protein KEN51_CDS0366 [Pseudomonas phage vB_Pae10145-KEN51]|nr:hypothetical protein [Pseudomonas phage ANB1]
MLLIIKLRDHFDICIDKPSVYHYITIPASNISLSEYGYRSGFTFISFDL